MDKVAEKKLFFKSISIDLKKVDYEKLNNKYSETSEQIKVITEDSYEISDVSINGFKLFYQRHVELEPKMLFDVKVSYEIFYEFADETIKEYKGKDEELKELVNIKAEKAINMTGVVSRASTLISCITMQNNGNSIVTQPNYSKLK